MSFDIPIENLGLAVSTILGLVCCTFFIAKAVLIGIDMIKEITDL